MSGYIYIAYDVKKPSVCKIGKTTRQPEKRITETTNPDYKLYKSYPVKTDSLNETERSIHKIVAAKGIQQLRHASSNRASEWFKCTKEEAGKIITNALEGHRSFTVQIDFLEQDTNSIVKAALKKFNYDTQGIVSLIEREINKFDQMSRKKLVPLHSYETIAAYLSELKLELSRIRHHEEYLKNYQPHMRLKKFELNMDLIRKLGSFS